MTTILTIISFVFSLATIIILFHVSTGEESLIKGIKVLCTILFLIFFIIIWYKSSTPISTIFQDIGNNYIYNSKDQNILTQDGQYFTVLDSRARYILQKNEKCQLLFKIKKNIFGEQTREIIIKQNDKEIPLEGE